MRCGWTSPHTSVPSVGQREPAPQLDGIQPEGIPSYSAGAGGGLGLAFFVPFSSGLNKTTD